MSLQSVRTGAAWSGTVGQRDVPLERRQTADRPTAVTNATPDWFLARPKWASTTAGWYVSVTSVSRVRGFARDA